MKVLFVRSGNRGIDPISTRQGESLVEQGVEVYYFDIIGKGILGYLGNALGLRKSVISNKVELIHAHYSSSAFLATLILSGKPIIVSLMGSDILNEGKFLFKLTQFLSNNFWSYTIVKSGIAFSKLGVSKSEVIPNGVNMKLFNQVDKSEALQLLGWDKKIKHVLFSSDPDRPEKNYILAQKAIKNFESQHPAELIEVHFLKDIPIDKIYLHYNAADLLLLTSLYEGSPNVIKEALSCNCPIVSTDVGDVKTQLKETNGCYITTFDPEDIAKKMKSAIEFGKRTNGREKIKHLDSRVVADQIIRIYQKVSSK